MSLTYLLFSDVLVPHFWVLLDELRVGKASVQRIGKSAKSKMSEETHLFHQVFTRVQVQVHNFDAMVLQDTLSSYRRETY